MDTSSEVGYCEVAPQELSYGLSLSMYKLIGQENMAPRLVLDGSTVCEVEKFLKNIFKTNKSKGISRLNESISWKNIQIRESLIQTLYWSKPCMIVLSSRGSHSMGQ